MFIKDDLVEMESMVPAELYKQNIALREEVDLLRRGKEPPPDSSHFKAVRSP